MLSVQKLTAKIGNKAVLKNISLEIKKGTIQVVMGPNGAGKSSLAKVIFGHPGITVSSGTLTFANKNIKQMKPEQRAALGMFMAFQYPREIAGLQLDRFLFSAYTNVQKMKKEKQSSVFEFNEILSAEMKRLHMPAHFAERDLNQGFSGGEKKKAEMLQLAVLKSSFALFDETDSGLDIDSLKLVSKHITEFVKRGGSALVITHYQKLLDYIQPDKVHVMIKGEIVASGSAALAKEIEKEGYAKYTK